MNQAQDRLRMQGIYQTCESLPLFDYISILSRLRLILLPRTMQMSEIG